MGEIVGDSVVLWKLLEPATSVLPSDFRSILPDLKNPAGVSLPAVVLGGVTGFGRDFTGVEHIEAVDTGSKLVLRRSMTLQFIVAFDLTAQDSAGVPGTMLSYGFRDSSPGEDLQFVVELDAVDVPSSRGNVRMRWEDDSGVLEATNVGADLIFPKTPGGVFQPLLITIVREFRDNTTVIVRYYANETFLGKDISGVGNIGGRAGATILMGARGDGAGGYENLFEGTIEAANIFDRIMTAEEVRQISRLITIHGPAGYDLIKSMVPDDVWSTDPASIIQRELFVEGQLAGSAFSKAAELVEDFLPDRAWSSLADWENVLRLPPNPGDTLAARRNRILSFLKANEGHTVGGVKNALVPTFGLDASQIEILEFTELLEDSFATQIADFWEQVPNSHSITNPSALLRIATASGVHHAWAISGSDHAPYVKANIDRDELEVGPSIDSEASVLIDNESLNTDDETLAGVAFYDQVDNSLLIWGIFSTGGAIRLGHVRINKGVQAAIVNVAAAPARPFHLNMKFSAAAGNTYDLGTAPSGDPNTVTVAAANIVGPTDPTFVLLGLFGLVTGGTLVDSLDFDNFRLFTPKGLRVFNWYAFRDPALGGVFDLPGAQKVVERIKPAHTAAAAVTTKALVCDDPDSLCDIGPLGG